ncbi:MAG TPA: TonB-dependent receptor [Rhizomicrobium sp.]
MNSQIKSLLMCGAAAAVMAAASSAFALPSSTAVENAGSNTTQLSSDVSSAATLPLVQVAQAINGDALSSADSDTSKASETVIVTGTRMRTNGNDLPTPVTVVTAAQLQATTPSDIPDGLNKLPDFAGARSSNSSENSGNGKGSAPTGNFLDIRGLGPIRTLILMDGKRVPSTYFDGTVDTNMLPEMLVQRVDVVTGGASAVYGSDAISGVVNFILDNKFEGVKGLIQGGISTYGDAKSFRAGIANGFDVGSRGHVVWSLEYYDRDAVPDMSARPYGNLDPELVGQGSAASPYIVEPCCVERSNLAYGGLVMSGPFKNQQFGPGGVLQPFVLGTPTPTANYYIGGDGTVESHEYLVPVIGIAKGFGRFDYDFSDTLKGYVQTSYAQSRTYDINQSLPLFATAYPLTIYSGNAFLLPQYQSALTATNTSSFSIGLYDNDINRAMSFVYQTGAFMVQTGLEGTVFDNFNWDAHYTHGDTRTMQTTHKNINAMRLYAAIDAVKDPSTGNIVCRVSLTAPGAYPGCVPFNVFGPGAASPQALSYIQGDTSWVARNDLDDFDANITGPLFNDWAGPVQFAAGVEYRLQSLVVTTSVPNNGVFDPQYLRAGTDGKTFLAKNQAWVKEFQSPASGAENVYEGDVEVDVPLLKDLPLAELVSFNGAYRYTNYSISGSANTWKAGLEWQILDDVKIRATRSRDFRAPTLWDLYQQPSTSSSGYADQLTGINQSTASISGGNPNLKPEVARNTTAGVVFTPRWAPGFSFSADYFHIAIDNAIGQVSGSNPSVQNICISSGGTSPLCSLTVRPFPITNTSPANFPTSYYTLNENVSHVYAEGIDFEADYETDLSSWSSLPGVMNFRGLWSHQPTYKTQTIAGAPFVNQAGTAQTPSDRATFTLGYKIGAFTFDALERYESAYHYNGDPTLVYNTPEVRAYFATDINFSYDFIAMDQPFTGFLAVDNLFNEQGGVYATTAASPGSYYPVGPGADIIGRYFTVGLRFKM